MSTSKQENKSFFLDNHRLRLQFDPQTGLSAVTDLVTGKTWTQYYAVGPQGGQPPIISDAMLDGGEITYFANVPSRIEAGLPPVKMTLTLPEDRPDEVTLTLSGDPGGAWYSGEILTGTFLSPDETMRWVLPKDSGLYLPAYDLENPTNRKYPGGDLYAHMGLNMAMFGGVNPSTGDGCYLLIETPVFTTIKYSACNVGEGKVAYLPHLVQIGTNDLWFTDRTVRYRFFQEGGYMGLAKTYRKIAEEKGFVVPLKEKAKKNPNILRGAGAHRVEPAIDIADTARFFTRLRQAGVTDVMVRPGAMYLNGAHIQRTELYELGVLKLMAEEFGEYYMYAYDCYRDVFTQPSWFKIDMNWVNLAMPYRLVWKDGYVRGWKEPSGVQSYVICPSFGPLHLDWIFKTKYPLDKYPFMARLFDVLATCGFHEGVCYDPNHPGTRQTCYDLRLDYARSATEDYGIDTHTEGAAEYLVPYANSGEGPLDIMGNECDVAGMNTMSVSPADRIPFWELIYHDCYGLYYHWEHGKKYPNEDNTRIENESLFCLLYGERGTYLPSFHSLDEGGEMDFFISQMKRISVVTRRVALERMIDHQFLTADGLVQKTAFSDGTEVIVNFSDRPYTYQNGQEIAPKKELILIPD